MMRMMRMMRKKDSFPHGGGGGQLCTPGGCGSTRESRAASAREMLKKIAGNGPATSPGPGGGATRRPGGESCGGEPHSNSERG